MTQTVKKRTRQSDGVTLTFSIKAKDEKTAMRILEHPALQRLLEAFEGKHEIGGQDKNAKNPYAHYTAEDFQKDVYLRSRAIKWLEVQHSMKNSDPEKVIRSTSEPERGIQDCIFELVMSNLPELGAVYNRMTRRIDDHKVDLTPPTMREIYGYTGSTKKLKEHLDYLRNMLKTADLQFVGDEKPQVILNKVCAWEGNAFAGAQIY